MDSCSETTPDLNVYVDNQKYSESERISQGTKEVVGVIETEIMVV